MPGDKTQQALTPAEVAGRLQARKGATLRSVMEALSAIVTKSKGTPKAQPPVPVEPTTEETEALDALGSEIAAIKWPTQVRALEPEEIETLTILRTGFIDPAEALIKRAKESMREAMFNHFDAQAEANGKVQPDTPIDAKGHYVLPDSESGRVPGCDSKLVRETRRGSMDFGEAVTLGDRLKALEDAGTIDHKTYLKFTKPARLLDEEAIFAAAKDDPEVYKIVAAITHTSAASASLNVRKNQDETT